MIALKKVWPDKDDSYSHIAPNLASREETKDLLFRELFPNRATTIRVSVHLCKSLKAAA